MKWKIIPHPTAFALYGNIWELEISGLKIHVFQDEGKWIMYCQALRFVACPLESEELIEAKNEAIIEIKNHLFDLQKYLSLSIVEI